VSESSKNFRLKISLYFFVMVSEGAVHIDGWFFLFLFLGGFGWSKQRRLGPEACRRPFSCLMSLSTDSSCAFVHETHSRAWMTLVSSNWA